MAILQLLAVMAVPLIMELMIRSETPTSGTILRVLLARLVGVGAATGAASLRSTCRSPTGSRTTRRTRAAASVFVSQAPLIL